MLVQMLVLVQITDTSAHDMFGRDPASRAWASGVLNPSAAGDVLAAYARERSRTGRSGIHDVTVTRDGKVIAEFRGRSRTISPGRPS